MASHFGVNVYSSKYGLNISREKYAIINNKSSVIRGKIYSNEWCEKHLENCLINYDLNMKYFSTLDRKEFDTELADFVKKKHFEEVFNINKYKDVSGYYILALDDFCQIYIGTTGNIRRRIMEHWNHRKAFDRLIFGKVENSIISIDSFRALDTTRIFAFKTDDIYSIEDDFITGFPSKFMLNRTVGGLLENGLIEAIAKRKTKELK